MTGVINYWLGAKDMFQNDTFYWLDDTTLDDGFTNWDPAEPHDGDEDGIVLHTSDWQWVNIKLDGQYNFLCEHDLGRIGKLL